ncbi:MAG: ComF family protein [Cytophagales bacterium]|nr:ComF family protein [Bernardetiaceae bacterium]MDW8209994.1 ComF family protein [Cytophagales bacterium]
MLLAKLWRDFVELVFPAVCSSCRAGLLPEEEMICITCRLNFPLTHFHRFPTQNAMFDKFKGRLPIALAAAFMHFNENGIAQKLSHQVKYRGNQQLGILLGRWYGNQLLQTDINSQFDCLVPVPLHRQRLKQRGYNQAACFAQGISQVVGLPLREDLVARIKMTSSQVGMDKQQRLQNIADAFEVTAKEQVSQLRILLVDDIVTTGATIEACAMPLVKAGCQKIGVLALANV